MNSRLPELFEDQVLREKIRTKLPHLFSIAEIESSRGGRVGMEVGSMRERVLIALLVYTFGKENVETEISIHTPEVDVRVFDYPVSIKTVTGTSGVKVIWTVDAQKAWEFFDSYVPSCDILLTQIKWNATGGLFLIPMGVQQETLSKIGRERYLKLPPRGTNPRGVEISREGLTTLLQHRTAKRIEILWERSHIDSKATGSNKS